MLLNATRIEVWSAPIEDRPGGLSEKLEALATAGASLEKISARRSSREPGGVVFVTPIEGEKQIQAAKNLGFAISESFFAVRAEGPDEPGIGAQVSSKLAAKGINLRGLSASRIGKHAVLHLAFDNAKDADAAVPLINSL